MQTIDFQQRMTEEVLEGLCAGEKYIPSKYFYDEKGGDFFDRITELDEYYLTRTEYAIFDLHLPEIESCLEPYECLIELGSGTSVKTRRLLDGSPQFSTYIPVDISEDLLRGSTRMLAERYPNLEILPLCADFTHELTRALPLKHSKRALVFFPGSTIGNFEYPQATEILWQIAELVGPGGGLLIGVDLAKDAAVVERAYNDRMGITAEFNKNILSHLNTRLGSNFDPEKFSHRAIYNTAEDRVEMYLVCDCAQTVDLGGTEIQLRHNEQIRTEFSYKYPLASFTRIAEDAGFAVDRVWLDDERFFSVQFLTVR